MSDHDPMKYDNDKFWKLEQAKEERKLKRNTKACAVMLKRLQQFHPLKEKK